MEYVLTFDIALLFWTLPETVFAISRICSTSLPRDRLRPIPGIQAPPAPTVPQLVCAFQIYISSCSHILDLTFAHTISRVFQLVIWVMFIYIMLNSYSNHQDLPSRSCRSAKRIHDLAFNSIFAFCPSWLNDNLLILLCFIRNWFDWILNVKIIIIFKFLHI